MTIELKDLMLTLKEMCETETPITLKSLVNTIDQTEYCECKIFENSYGDLGYFDHNYKGIAILLATPEHTDNDISIFVVPYNNSKQRRAIDENDQIIIISVEAYYYSFNILAQNKKYIKSQYAKDCKDIDEFIDVCMEIIKDGEL